MLRQNKEETKAILIANSRFELLNFQLSTLRFHP